MTMEKVDYIPGCRQKERDICPMLRPVSVVVAELNAEFDEFDRLLNKLKELAE